MMSEVYSPASCSRIIRFRRNETREEEEENEILIESEIIIGIGEEILSA